MAEWNAETRERLRVECRKLARLLRMGRAWRRQAEKARQAFAEHGMPVAHYAVGQLIAEGDVRQLRVTAEIWAGER